MKYLAPPLISTFSGIRVANFCMEMDAEKYYDAAVSRFGFGKVLWFHSFSVNYVIVHPLLNVDCGRFNFKTVAAIQADIAATCEAIMLGGKPWLEQTPEEDVPSFAVGSFLKDLAASGKWQL